MMSKRIVICAVLCLLILSVQCRPQDEDYEEDESNGSQIFPASTAPKYAPQCTYDYKGRRINKECPCDQPPKCERGYIVKTSVGEDYEMCCCNFTNYIEE